MNEPYIISGNSYADERGILFYNNDLRLDEVKRLYFIESVDLHTVRGWQGHKIEKRWFSAVVGSFEIEVISFENMEKGSAIEQKFELDSPAQVLHVPAGYLTAIRSREPNSRLLVFADYALKEIKDEYRFPYKN